jgi:tRNA1(Val) A37 N6-methylase TrmN6
VKNALLSKSKEELDTINSFNYQWTHLSDSKYLLTEESWKSNVDQYILDELSVSRKWIMNKSVIDVGAEAVAGLWFCKACCKVTSVDISEGPCELAQRNVPS